MSKRLAILAVATGCMLCAAATYGQGSDARSVRLLVPFSPGGPTDQAARLVAPTLSAALGRNVVIDNRGGVNGVVGTELGAKAAPDGSTLVMGNSGTHAINVGLYRKLPYDPQRSFVAISEVIYSGLVMVVNPRVAVGTLGEFIALAKKNPGKLNIGVAGPVGQLAGEALKAQTQIDLTNVNYKGSPPTEFAVLQGEVSVSMLTPLASAAHIGSGRLKALGVTTSKRMTMLPHLPTIAEAGVKGYEVELWHGLFAPVGVPDKIVRTLNKELANFLGSQEVKDRVVALGFEVAANTPEQFAALVKRDIAKYTKLIIDAGIPRE